MTRFNFRQFTAADVSFLRGWLNQTHVRPHWQETEEPEKLARKFLEELPARGVHPFIIELDGNAIGYIQYYEAASIGGGWWANEKPGTFGIDLMIGSSEHIGRGFGALIVKAFVLFVSDRESGVTSFIIDPDPDNVRAIRAFTRAGFISESEIQTPGGRALLMRRPS